MWVDRLLANGGGSSPGQLFGELWPWLLALVLLVGVGAVVIYFLRRTMSREEGSVEGFTLHDLRKMHTSGQLSDEEFERAKASIIGRLAETGPETEGESSGSKSSKSPR
jgi:hypothetical protein